MNVTGTRSTRNYPIYIELYAQYIMLVKSLLISLIASAAAVLAASGKAASQLQVGVKYKPDDCPLKSRNGDKLSMQ